MTLAYYPGCTGLGTSTDYDKSTRAVCDVLGIIMQDIPDWNCCGSTPGHVTDATLSASLSARNLVQAKNAGMDAVMTPCPSCLLNLKTARAHITESEAFGEKVARIIEMPVEGLPDTRSVIQVLYEDAGLEEIAKRVVKPLAGLKVAPYYGCVMTRPAEIMRFDDVERPMSMDHILEALGAEVLPFPLKVECCGASSGIPRREVSARLSGRILAAAKALGADALVVACPLCQMNLDLRQPQALKAIGQSFEIPVFYFTQLMGLAFGLKPGQLGIEKLSASPDAALKKIEAAGAAKAPESKESTGGAA